MAGEYALVGSAEVKDEDENQPFAWRRKKPSLKTSTKILLCIGLMLVLVVVVSIPYRHDIAHAVTDTQAALVSQLAVTTTITATVTTISTAIQTATVIPTLVHEQSKFFLPNATAPQLIQSDHKYDDIVVGLNTSDPKVITSTEVKKLRYAVLIPIYEGHFPELSKFLRSLKCLCTDHAEIDIHVVVSNAKEGEQLRTIINTLPDCGETFGLWDVPESNRGPDHKLDVNIVELLDILPDELRPKDLPEDTDPLLASMGKWGYVAAKKLLMAFHFDYDWALWLDAEAIAVQPFSIRETFDAYASSPTIFRSRMAREHNAWEITAGAAFVLGRSPTVYGAEYWAMESLNWFVEKAVINDLQTWVQAAHGSSFWSVFAQSKDKGRYPFETNLYSMHVHARKLETVDDIFSKYQVLETEREMLRFGMAPTFHTHELIGLERGYKLLDVPEIAPNFAAFCRRYSQRLFRMDSLDFGPPPEVLDRFLMRSQVSIIASGAAPLHEWWTERAKDNSINKTMLLEYAVSDWPAGEAVI
ncbi:hypothetical protein ANO11243_066990 [Dothideomycetidae sp. 11243]|nr:hypothetical protein ANO11243_066990 [fungal sp. No.11243]